MSILTGFSQLDDITGGLRPNELTVIASRPGIGMTSLCQTLADNIKKQGKRVRIGIDTLCYSRTAKSCEELYDMVSKDPETGKKYDVVFFSALYPVDKRQAADIYGRLKAFAADEGIAVVVETAIDKRVERSATHRPSIEHIKYPAAVEKYADNIFILYREGYYDVTVNTSTLEIVVTKSSAGRLGTVTVKICCLGCL